jgi:hypothetical protein
MVNFERPREVQSSLEISVTEYFIVNFKGNEGKKEKSREFGMHGGLE